MARQRCQDLESEGEGRVMVISFRPINHYPVLPPADIQEGSERESELRRNIWEKNGRKLGSKKDKQMKGQKKQLSLFG